MIILGIDPGATTIGYGLIKKTAAKEIIFLEGGCLQIAPGQNAEQLKELYSRLTDLIKKCRPSVVALEKIFFFKNAKTVISVSQARGVIMLAARLCHLPIFEFTPLQIKQAVTGYGRADKNQIQKMVQILLRLKEIPRPDDMADALAAAICCAHSSRELSNELNP